MYNFYRVLFGLLLTGSLVFSVSVVPVGAATNIDAKVAVLRALDKITGRITTFSTPVGETVRFGSLSIIVRACRKSPPAETPESAAFLDITDIKLDSPPIDAFRGWMFASSPAVSAMDHAVYDVWVIECRKPLPPAENTSPIETGNCEKCGDVKKISSNHFVGLFPKS